MRLTSLLAVSLLLTACGDDPAPEIPCWAKVAPEQIAEAKKHSVPVAFENDLGMRFVLIPAGTFLMGSPEDEEGRPESQDPTWDWEPRRKVTITQPFYICIHEVTNEQFRAFRQNPPTTFDRYETDGPLRRRALAGDRQPVVMVSVNGGVREFLVWLTDRSEARRYRLPTDAEWEHACRAGTTTRFPWGDEEADAHRHSNAYDQETQRQFQSSAVGGGVQPAVSGDDGYRVSAPVCSLEPNRWGLYDMCGNVSEWCQGWFRADSADEEIDPLDEQIPLGLLRIVRGGGWRSSGPGIRAASRGACEDGPCDEIGFRVVSPLPNPGER